MDIMLTALKLTGLGLGGVFLSLILFYFLIRILGSAFKEKKD